MAPKHQLEKQAWKWAETTAAENISVENIKTAYRIDLKPCKQGTCRKNCRGNPHCLQALGEGHWLRDIDPRNWSDIGNPIEEKRKEEEFVGLKNLGATCYVNTFLQVWFQNSAFRRAIFLFDELMHTESNPDRSDDSDVKGSTAKLDALAMPVTACGHLQLIFGLLQFSHRRYIDPTPFIQSLGLDSDQQQDAQEFSKLFTSLLEQQGGMTRAVIEQQFQGEYDYVTICRGCGQSSRRSSFFYELELNIKGQKDLGDCIGDFLKEEHLEGDNQYQCQLCNGKRDATRKIVLRSLPPVLNLQLLRFVFARETGHKKKLNTYILFPEVMDISNHLNQPEGAVVYDLTAVLIHRGPSAYSGHYVAMIRPDDKQSWYKFNDEEIVAMKGKGLQLANEEEGQGGKKPRAVKGCHSSRNAYMLVYHRRDAGAKEQAEDIPLSQLPISVQSLITADNKRLGDWIHEMTSMKDRSIAEGHLRQAEIVKLYNMLPDKNDGQWIKTDWLINWLKPDVTTRVTPIDNSCLLCPHGNVNPDKVADGKCVSQEAFDLLLSRYGGGPQIKRSALCEACVRERCRQIHLRTRLAEDSKAISSMLKKVNHNESIENSFWVGKSSLRSWRRLVTEKLGVTGKSHSQQQKADEQGETETNDQGDSVDKTEDSALDACENKGLDEAAQENDGENGDMGNGLEFNEDLLCEDHGQLSSDSLCKRLVPQEIWVRFLSYFPDAPQFSVEDEECSLCKIQEEEAAETRDLNRVLAAEQKAALSDLFTDRHRPVWGLNVSQLFVVSQNFLESWRRFIRDPVKREPVSLMDNRILLCPHGGFLYEPAILDEEVDDYRPVYIWPQEWEKLRQVVSVDEEIKVERHQDIGGDISYNVTPDVCADCCQARLAAEAESQLDYQHTLLYIRRLTDSTTNLESADPNRQDADDPEFTQAPMNGKRKISNFASNSQGAQTEKCARLDDQTAIRRSTRHRRLRGEKEVNVSATDTLRDLKLKVMKLFSVAPFDQHIMMDGMELNSDKSTLAALRILPHSILYLKVDEPVEDPTFLDDATKATVPEEGFKGTGLLAPR